MSYTYSKLRKGDIRLLEIVPQSHIDADLGEDAADNDDSEDDNDTVSTDGREKSPSESSSYEDVPEDYNLHFKVHHFARNATPEYTALSYTWARGKATEVIWLNGSDFRVRTNLWDGLRAITRSPHFHFRFLWVDAICIDQGNAREKSDQVNTMSQTYANAEVVSVWLGQANNKEEWHWASSLTDIASRPYWSRAWVVQEYLLARDVHLWCDRHVIEEKQLRELFTYRQDLLNLRRGNSAAAQRDRWTSRARCLLASRELGVHLDIELPLETLLSRHKDFQCEDSRDRLFSLLSLMSPEERRDIDRFHPLPDYSLDADTVVGIALSHILYHDKREISDDVFKALGVNGRKERNAWLASIAQRKGSNRRLEPLLKIKR